MPISVLKDIRKIYAGLNAEAIRASAWQKLNIGLMASSPESYARMERFFAPGAPGSLEHSQAMNSVHRVNGSPTAYDLVFCEPGVPVPENGFVFSSDLSGPSLNAILTKYPKLELALARTFPLLRSGITQHIVARVSRENALFSLVTALPNVVPNLFELPWAVGEFATDTAFLTMNQIRMALSLAAAHGHTVGYTEQKAQIAAIAAGAFGWRAIARELIGKIPLGGGLIPKAAVSFAGTYVVGLGLEKLNRTGSGLTNQEKRDAYADAFAKGKDIARDLAPTLRETSARPAV